MNLQELKDKLESRMRQLKNADPEQVGFLKRKIAELELEIRQIEESTEKPAEILNDYELKVSGKKVKFNKAGAANLEYNSLLKQVDQKHYIIIYASSVNKDAELSYGDGRWNISCCETASFPNFEWQDLGQAITFVLDFMHEKHSGITGSTEPVKEVPIVTTTKAEIPVDIIEEVQKKPRKKKMSDEMEDLDELERYLEILDEILATSKSDSVKSQIESEKLEVQELIMSIKNQ